MSTIKLVHRLRIVQYTYWVAANYISSHGQLIGSHGESLGPHIWVLVTLGLEKLTSNQCLCMALIDRLTLWVLCKPCPSVFPCLQNGCLTDNVGVLASGSLSCHSPELVKYCSGSLSNIENTKVLS